MSTDFLLEDFLPYQITVLASHIALAFSKQHAERFGLSIPEWRVVATIGRYQSVTSAFLQEKTAMDKAKVSRAVTRLVASKLLERTENQADLRSNYLSLTPEGLTLFNKIVPIAKRLEQEMISQVSAEELATFKKVLQCFDQYILQEHQSSLDGNAYV